MGLLANAEGEWDIWCMPFSRDMYADGWFTKLCEARSKTRPRFPCAAKGDVIATWCGALVLTKLAGGWSICVI